MSPGPVHLAPRQDEGDEDKRITYSRDSLPCVRGAASEACRDKLPAGIVACKNEVEAALMCDWDPRASEPPQTSAGRSKSKICTRFFSNADCRFGNNCRYLHQEQAAVGKKMKNLNLGLGDPAPARAPRRSTAPATTVKTRLCKNHNRPEGCKWGDRCYLAHGEGELRKPMGPGSSFKTRLCVSFITSGSCAFSGKCHFAHGKDELRNSEAESE